MNKDEINRAIAEARGYNVEPCTCEKFAWRDADCGGHTPDYFSDLNACHEVAMSLDRESLAYSQYCSHLNQIVAIYNSRSGTRPIQACDATAPQRCEAFLRTLNLWRAEP